MSFLLRCDVEVFGMLGYLGGFGGGVPFSGVKVTDV